MELACFVGFAFDMSRIYLIAAIILIACVWLIVIESHYLEIDTS